MKFRSKRAGAGHCLGTRPIPSSTRGKSRQRSRHRSRICDDGYDQVIEDHEAAARLPTRTRRSLMPCRTVRWSTLLWTRGRCTKRLNSPRSIEGKATSGRDSFQLLPSRGACPRSASGPTASKNFWMVYSALCDGERFSNLGGRGEGARIVISQLRGR
jgi:hypothetical protein